jgi:hypothetical protein
VGFLSPSLDGGLPLFELFKPSWRSSLAIGGARAALSALNAQSAHSVFPWTARPALRDSSES